MIIEEPDFKKAVQTADEILVSSKEIKAFPFMLIPVIIEYKDFELRTFGWIEKKGISAKDSFLSNDAELKKKGGMYILFYNEMMPPARLIFSCTHELGHYMLGHPIDSLSRMRDRNDPKFLDLYRICEVEANFFAAELLMPEPIIVELFKRGCKITEEFLIKHFEVSREAAKKRIELLRKAYDWNNFNRYPDSCNYDDIIVEKYKKFIDSIAPQKFKYGYSLEQDLELEKQRETWV